MSALCANGGHLQNGLRQKERPPRSGLSEIRSGAISRSAARLKHMWVATRSTRT